MTITITEMLARLALAMGIGCAVGLERAFRDKPAGFRTNILICVGACVFTIGSISVSGPMIDQTRIAAQIVTGVGFLGAGAIIRDAKGVIGLTTAATIWVVAALGMAAGLGEFALASAGTVAVILVLVVFPLVADLVEFRRDMVEYKLSTVKSKEMIERVDVLFGQSGLKIVMKNFYEGKDGIVFEVRALGPRRGHQRFREAAVLSDEVRICAV